MFSVDLEWLKILISAATGLFAGLIADPIRAVIQLRITTIRMESAVQFDFIALFTAMKSVEVGAVSADCFWLGVELPAFDYYWERNREIFYNSLELQILRFHCVTVQRLKGLVCNKQMAGEEAMKKLDEVVVQVRGMQKPLTWKRRIAFKLVR